MMDRDYYRNNTNEAEGEFILSETTQYHGKLSPL